MNNTIAWIFVVVGLVGAFVAWYCVPPKPKVYKSHLSYRGLSKEDAKLAAKDKENAI